MKTAKTRPFPRRDITPGELVTTLRAALGLPPQEPVPGESAAWLRRPTPSLIRELDVGGWIAWCRVGLFLFAEDFPTMAKVRSESRQFASALAMLRARGNVTRAAGALGISRKSLRDHLRAAGLHPWHNDDHDRHGDV